tara:strand:- start:1992 stop:2984 length:993 start_codon:yes stop_codon:yes gene_type:complete
MSKWLKLSLGFILSFLGLYFAFQTIDLNDLLKSFESINYFWIFVAIILLIFYTYIRSLRWRLLLFSLELVTIKDLFASNMVGYFGNSILPFKMGEILRGYAISRNNDLKTSTVLGSIVLERVCDLGGLLILLLFVTLFYSFPYDIGLSLIISATAILLILILLWFISFKKEFIMNKIKGTQLMDFKTVISFIKTLSSFSIGFSSLNSFRSFIYVSLLTIVSWFILYLVTYYTLLSLNLQIGWVEIAVVLLLTSMAMSVPAAPGAIGTHHFATYYVMNSLLDFNSIDSQTFAIVLHAVSYLPLVAIGAYYFFKSSIQIFDIFDKDLSDEKI